ncbi:MAG: hypothetical protein KDE15_04235 [Erythrobacter sp.]|nr:hypothetical protein [Erythrobacter sp.]
MARISPPSVPVKMYKHFAVITVLLTATIALFADGENRQAIAAHFEQNQLHAQEQSRASRPVSAPRLVRNDAAANGSFDSGGEFDGGFGAPTDIAGSRSGRAITGPRSRSGGRQLLPNMSPEEVSALSDEEYERLRRLYVEAHAIEDTDRSAQISEIEAASARRMGHSGSDS